MEYAGYIASIYVHIVGSPVHPADVAYAGDKQTVPYSCRTDFWALTTGHRRH